jgi:hypothetical protein
VAETLGTAHARGRVMVASRHRISLRPDGSSSHGNYATECLHSLLLATDDDRVLLLFHNSKRATQ